MKFKNPTTGEVYDVQDGCDKSGFCRGIPICTDCPIFPIKDISISCADWVNSHPNKAAELMGYELVPDQAVCYVDADDQTGENGSTTAPERAIAVDFDGTLFRTRWPEILRPNRHVIDRALEEHRKGAKLILWTCREGHLLEEALAACKKEGLHFDAVNDSLESWKRAFGGDSRKIGATEYWDDRAINPAERFAAKSASEEDAAERPVYFEEFENMDPDSRRGILLRALRCVCGDRDQDYGSPEHSLAIIGRFWADYIQAKYGVEVPISGADTSAMMVLFKMARVATGHGKADNWVDAAGYAACGGELENIAKEEAEDDEA